MRMPEVAAMVHYRQRVLLVLFYAAATLHALRSQALVDSAMTVTLMLAPLRGGAPRIACTLRCVMGVLGVCAATADCLEH